MYGRVPPGEALTCTCTGMAVRRRRRGGIYSKMTGPISVNNPNAIRALATSRPLGRFYLSAWRGGVPRVGRYKCLGRSGQRGLSHRIWASDIAFGPFGWPARGRDDLLRLPSERKKLGVTSNVPRGHNRRCGKACLEEVDWRFPDTQNIPREALALVRYLPSARPTLNANRFVFSLERPSGMELYDLPREFWIRIPTLLPSQREPWDACDCTPLPASSATNSEQVTRAYIKAVHSVLTGEREPAKRPQALEKETDRNYWSQEGSHLPGVVGTGQRGLSLRHLVAPALVVLCTLKLFCWLQ